MPGDSAVLAATAAATLTNASGHAAAEAPDRRIPTNGEHFMLGDMTIQRMDNVGIVVDDLDAAVAFFTELGMEPEGEAQIEAWGSEKTSRDWQGGHLHNRLPRRRRSIP